MKYNVPVISPQNKKAIIDLLESGKSIEEIQQKMGYTKQQIAAVHAHITIGTYKAKAHPITENDKLRIIDFGKQGLNSKEILVKTKMSYSPQQIAGILATCV